MKNQIMQVLAIQKKSFPTPEQNMDDVRRILDGYSGDRPDFILLLLLSANDEHKLIPHKKDLAATPGP